MAGLDPAILGLHLPPCVERRLQTTNSISPGDVDGRVKPGHDGLDMNLPYKHPRGTFRVTE
jgi:hypothetical protein